MKPMLTLCRSYSRQFLKYSTAINELSGKGARQVHSKKYPWVYGENDQYNRRDIEEKFTAVSNGGSIDLLYENDMAIVTMNNPAKRNALTGSMLVQLQEVVKELWDWDEGKAVILCGADDTFCSGLDLSLVKQFIELDPMGLCTYMQNTLTLFQSLPMITVAAIKGDTLGGGAEVCTASDFRLVFPQSRIEFVQKKLGVIPGLGGLTRLRQIIGRRKTMHLLASSEPVDAKTALLYGLADALATDSPDLSVTDVTKEWLEQTYGLSKTDATIFRAIKSATNHPIFREHELSPSITTELRRERDIFVTVCQQLTAKNKTKLKT